MIITNKKKTIFLRRLFFLVSLGLAAGSLLFFLTDLMLCGLIMIGLFALWYLFYQVADYQYIEFSTEEEKILLRYYPVVSLGKTSFNAIEFPQKLLHHVRFESSFFGKLSDITLIIKTNRGIASFPSVSLTALAPEERLAIREALMRITET